LQFSSRLEGKTSKSEYKYGSKFLDIEMALTFYLPFDCKIIKKNSLVAQGPCCYARLKKKKKKKKKHGNLGA
jgi:hypothetical protein